VPKSWLLFAGILTAMMFLLHGGALAQSVLQQAPYWQGTEKSQIDIRDDTQFVEKALALNGGDRRKAAEQALSLAGTALGEGDGNTAVLRLNQAWLIDPDYAPIYWAMAVAVHMRGDDTAEVERQFEKAEKRNGRDARLLADHGRAMEERDELTKARSLFEEALRLSPDYPVPHVGMISIARKTDDADLEAVHQARIEAITGKRIPQIPAATSE